MLSHLDAMLRALDPSHRADTVPPKRIRRVKLFGSGELNRLTLDMLRRGGQPMTPGAIAAGIVEEKGYGEPALPALMHRVRANLVFMLRGGRVVKTGNRLTARWALPP